MSELSPDLSSPAEFSPSSTAADNPPARGVIYVATGPRFVAEANESRAQLRRSNPLLPAAIVTDLAAPGPDWQHVLPIDAPTYGFRDKLHLRRAPWRHVLFLDTDTHVADSLDPVFALLDGGFDLAAHQLFEGHDYGLPDVPDSFPEFNTGVIAFRNTAAVQAFFDAWTVIFDTRPPPYPTDQYSFRIAVFHSGLRHTVLTPEYNFRPLTTNFAMCGLRIIHGRPLAGLPRIKALVDANFVHRAWVPRLDCVVSDRMTLPQTWRLWRAVTLDLLKAASRPLRRWIKAPGPRPPS